MRLVLGGAGRFSLDNIQRSGEGEVNAKSRPPILAMGTAI